MLGLNLLRTSISFLPSLKSINIGIFISNSSAIFWNLWRKMSPNKILTKWNHIKLFTMLLWNFLSFLFMTLAISFQPFHCNFVFLFLTSLFKSVIWSFQHIQETWSSRIQAPLKADKNLTVNLTWWTYPNITKSVSTKWNSIKLLVKWSVLQSKRIKKKLSKKSNLKLRHKVTKLCNY